MMKKNLRFMVPGFIAIIFVVLAIASPEAAGRSAGISLDYFKEMILIMPPVFIMMGLLEVWVPKDQIKTWLGQDSGHKGALIAFLLGTLPTGPLYVAFPMAGVLLQNGARVRNMVIFLGSWAALKIPQMMVEMKFIGGSFMILRFVLTLIALFMIGSLMEILLQKKPEKEGLM